LKVRTSAKAIIIENGRILLAKMRDSRGDYYILPGGGQEYGETLYQTVQRECIEELGMEVDVGSLLFVREYIGKNHEHAAFHGDIHQVEFIFACSILSSCLTPINLDKGQIGQEWINLHELEHYRLYPKKMIPVLLELSERIVQKQFPIYLGDIN
jgi:8-oxo-dGTP diphosphatase